MVQEKKALAKKYACWGIQFCSGGAGYGLLEILWRGYTHFSMLLAGGVCFWLIIRIAGSKLRIFNNIMIGGLCITFTEFVFGCVVNLWLGLNVWDYSSEPCQLMGQVCIRYALLWCLVCAIAIPLCRAVLKNRYVWRRILAVCASNGRAILRRDIETPS